MHLINLLLPVDFLAFIATDKPHPRHAANPAEQASGSGDLHGEGGRRVQELQRR